MLKKFSQLLIFILLTTTLLVNINSYDIIPNKRIPLMINIPHIQSESPERTVTLTFKLNENVRGPLNEHSFVVNFPNNSVSFRDTDTCTMSIGDSNIDINNTHDWESNDRKFYGNDFYCKIIQNQNDVLNKPKEDFKIVLKLTKGILVNYIENISVSLLTTNPFQLNPIILAKSPFFSDAGNYGDFITSNPPLKASVVTARPSVTPIGCPDPCTLLYPDQDFEFVIRLETFEYIPTLKDAVVTLEFTGQATNSGDMQIFSENFDKDSNNILESPLLSTGVLGYVPYRGNEYIITNIGENLIAGRKFTLVLSGLKTKMPVPSIGKDAIIRVYWTNTKSLISYNSLKLNFPVSPLPITFTYNPTSDIKWEGIAHPEFDDIYENGAYPLRFIFTIPPVVNGGFMRIEHESTSSKIFNFIASTCDFSDNINQQFISNKFGERPMCYATRNELQLNENENVDASTINGNANENYHSGLFFKVPKNKDETTISVIVWGVALKCGENILTGSDRILYDNLYSFNNNKNVKKLNFKYSLYTEIDQTQTGNFFNDANKLAELSNVEMYGNCFATILNSPSHNGVENNEFRKLYEDEESITVTKDLLLYKETYDWNLTQRSKNENINSFRGEEELYLFSTDDTQKAYLKDEIEFGTTTGIFDFPMPFYTIDKKLDNIPVPRDDDEYALHPGFVSVTLNSAFITSTDRDTDNDDCMLKWYTNSQKDTEMTSGNNFASLKTEGQAISESRSSLWQAGGLPTDVTKFKGPITIATNDLYQQQIGATNKATFGLGKDDIRIQDVKNMAFYTDCYKFRTTEGLRIRSIYSYIDFTYKFHRIPQGVTDNSTIVTRVGRFVKLLPNGQVFQAPESQGALNASSIDHELYYVPTNASSELCILRVNVSRASSTDFNSLMITLLNMTLLDIDAYQTSSRYPSVQVSDLKKVYSSNTVYPYNIGTYNSFNGGMLNYSKNGSTEYDFDSHRKKQMEDKNNEDGGKPVEGCEQKIVLVE